MDFTPTFGWYYVTADNRAPAWAGVDEFFNFITGAPQFVNAGGNTGPRGFNVTDGRVIDRGDVIQLANDRGEFYHSLLISELTDNDILVCAHSDDALDRPISTYNFATLRVIHIEKATIELDTDTSFNMLINGTAIEVATLVE